MIPNRLSSSYFCNNKMCKINNHRPLSSLNLHNSILKCRVPPPTQHSLLMYYEVHILLGPIRLVIWQCPCKTSFKLSNARNIFNNRSRPSSSNNPRRHKRSKHNHSNPLSCAHNSMLDNRPKGKPICL